MTDMPTMSSSSYAHTAYGNRAGVQGMVGLCTSGTGNLGVLNQSLGQLSAAQLSNYYQNVYAQPIAQSNTITVASKTGLSPSGSTITFVAPQQKDIEMDKKANGSLRVVRVFLVDPDTRVPVEKRVLHKTEEITTDATDQELFFEIPVSDLLKVHNKFRESIPWEDGEGETKIGLKDVRVRDLVMSVTTLAQF